MRTRAVSTFIFAVAVMVPQEALTGGITLQETTLERIAHDAPYVVEAKLVPDAAARERYALRFEVVARLTPGSEAVSDTIYVWQPSAEANGHRRRAYDRNREMRWILVPSLPTSATLKNGDTSVLFLRDGYATGEYVFEAENAHVTPAQLHELKALQRFAWVGTAMSSPNGAQLVTSSGVHFIDGLKAWPPEIAGQRVTVTGRLVRTKGSDAWRFESAHWRLASAVRPDGG